jgi:hypothetical protein
MLFTPKFKGKSEKTWKNEEAGTFAGRVQLRMLSQFLANQIPLYICVRQKFNMDSLKEVVTTYQVLTQEWNKKPQNLDKCGELLGKLKVLGIYKKKPEQNPSLESICRRLYVWLSAGSLFHVSVFNFALSFYIAYHQHV